MQNAPKFKVYCLINPLDNQIRYIGITSRSLDIRLKEHLQKSRFEQTYKDYWICSLKSKGVEPIIELVDEIDDYNFWEPYYISLYKSWGFKLVNSTNGGDYSELSIESKKKISLKLKGNTHGFKKGHIPVCGFKKGHTVTKNKKLSESHKQNLRKSLLDSCGIPVNQYDLSGNFIKEWPSANAAHRELGIHNSKINMVCRGHRNKAGGFIWKYK